VLLFDNHLQGFRKEGALTQERLGKLEAQLEQMARTPPLRATHQQLQAAYEQALQTVDRDQPASAGPAPDPDRVGVSRGQRTS
jgi:hypothetical protein